MAADTPAPAVVELLPPFTQLAELEELVRRLDRLRRPAKVPVSEKLVRLLSSSASAADAPSRL